MSFTSYTHTNTHVRVHKGHAYQMYMYVCVYTQKYIHMPIFKVYIYIYIYIHIYSWPFNNMGVWGTNLLTIEDLSITWQSVCGYISLVTLVPRTLDSTNHRSCSTVLSTIEKTLRINGSLQVITMSFKGQLSMCIHTYTSEVEVND